MNKPSRSMRQSRLASEYRESLRMALQSVASHKLRSTLTLLGILIGVFSIIIVMTAMRVLRNNLESELAHLGSHTFRVEKRPLIEFGGRQSYERYRRRKNITLNHVRTVQERASLAQAVGVETSFWSGEVQSRFEKSPPNIALFGVSQAAFPCRNWYVATGRAFIDLDVDHARRVCVLGHSASLSLFPYGAPLGESVKVDGIRYTVIGILEAKGALMGNDQDNLILIPITTGLNRYRHRSMSLSILVQAASQELFDETVDQVRGILRSLRQVAPGDPDDFEILSNDSLIEQFRTITQTTRIGVALVSSIALIAAGIGIMNIMLVSVTERTREIGLRRAVGARHRSILAQFLLEAVVLCQLGGLAGVVLGLLGGNATAWFLKLPPALPLDWALYGLVICSVVGLVFGTYPALKAARLDPIDSLRYE